jgi:hypothetical protein
MTAFNNGLQLINSHKRTTAAVVGGALLATGIGTALAIHSHKKRSSKSKRSSKRKVRAHKQRYPHTAGKRKDRSRKRIRFTKNNQPYVILASGKARFISKKSARISRKRTGGRY